VSLPAPEWRPRDTWVYDWTSGDRIGTKTLEVLETRTVNNVPYHVVRLDDVDHYYTTALHWAAAIREGRVEARMVPAQPWFMWPLTASQRWEHRGTFEDRNGTSRFNDRFTAVGMETVDVEAMRNMTLAFRDVIVDLQDVSRAATSGGRSCIAPAR